MSLSREQIAQLWTNRGGNPAYANLMARIALRESGGRPKINNAGTNSNGTTDWGLFQVNDVWRRDPVVGPLFRSGAILTPAGNTKAAIHILKVQGPKAWATYNPSTDRQYLGGLSGNPSPPSTAPKPKTPVVPDNRAQRFAAYAQYAQNPRMPGASTDLALSLLNAQQQPQVPAPAPKRAKRSTPTVKGHGPLFELFWQGQGGIDVKNGQPEPQGFVSGHTDHVHVAAGPNTVVRLGKLAQRMGLHVGENPHFGGVHPVHVADSYHYKGEAIDVSGDPGRMRAYAHVVAKIFGVK